MARVGLVGAGVMGAAFSMNLAENGHDVMLFGRTISKMQKVIDQATEEGLKGEMAAFNDPAAFVASLPKPRSILLLVPQGGPMEMVIEQLTPHLEKGDLIADLGNSNFRDTNIRTAELEADGLQFLGIGVSGGEEGARHGPAIMAGGSPDSWEQVKGPLEDASAKFKGEPCCNWFGAGGAGHFIKTLHNGIEYADMEQIAEVYGVMRDGLGMTAGEIADVFKKWMKGPLNSYLVEIAGSVAEATDPESGKPMLDIILDKAGQKGTGRWSVIEALHLATPTGMMSAAVEARNISARLDTRQEMESAFGPSPMPMADVLGSREQAIAALENAMIAAKVCAYIQGLEVLKMGSEEFGWDLDLGAVARVWRAGCIIRSVFLDEISTVMDSGGSPNLALSEVFAARLTETMPDLRKVVAAGVEHGQPVAALFSALDFHNTRRTARGTANMIQGLRDYFGAHGFERTDKDGKDYHGPWALNLSA